MTTITEDYVSFEIAKLLKEKGFNNDDCPTSYDSDGEFFWYGDYSKSRHSAIDAPTLQMAMKWLREVHHIEIVITFGFPFIDGKQQYKYFWRIVKVYNNHLEYPMDDLNSSVYDEGMTDSYEQAIEEAIKYCLENLI